MHHATDRIAHTMAFVTPIVEHWLEQEITQWVHHNGQSTTSHYLTGNKRSYSLSIIQTEAKSLQWTQTVQQKHCSSVNLFDLWPLVELWIFVQVAIRILSPFPSVGFSSNSVHGHSECRVRFIRDTAKTHRTCNNTQMRYHLSTNNTAIQDGQQW